MLCRRQQFLPHTSKAGQMKWVAKVPLPELWGPKGLERGTTVPPRLENSSLWKQFREDDISDLAQVLSGLSPSTLIELLGQMDQDIVKRYNVSTGESALVGVTYPFSSMAMCIISTMQRMREMLTHDNKEAVPSAELAG